LIYHNHDIEFKSTEGQLPFDVLLPALDPEYVNIELDLYWIAKGNSSAEEYIQKYPGRYPVFHVKDMDRTTDRSFACVGDGIINFPSIFKLNSVAGVKHFIVEHDRPANPEDCVKRSAEYLKNLRF
ncbi:MAG: sugar phosphate isomerase/epimerase, partial [Tannerellaceae bacterium]|nr:sugar phosphate isomerase/epimerase [Tannerellaceae bacterium]